MSSVEMKSMRRLDDDAGRYENKAYMDDEPNQHSQHVTSNPDDVTLEIKDGTYDKADGQTDEADLRDYNAYQRALLSLQSNISESMNKNARNIKLGIGVFLVLLYFAYFAYAMYYRFGDEGSWRLLGFTVLVVVIIVLVNLYRSYNSEIDEWWDSTQDTRESKSCDRFMTFVKWFLRIGVFLAVVIYIIIDIAIKHPQNLISVAGLVIYIIIFYFTSKNPAKVNWHTVFWGIALQYIFALLILRTFWGYEMFKWLGDRVTEFLEYTVAGIIFVFGDKYTDHFFAMKVLSIIVFFFTFINILYYIGAMQAIVKILGRFLAFCMGTTPAESINAAANIFVSMTESPLMIRPFLKDMTRSELHAVMTGGFATIAGSVLGAYISFGVPANHLLSASVMSAPAALAMSKLSYPETEISKGTSKDFDKLQKAPEHNLIEAASNGASASIKIVGAVAVNVLAFLSLLAFLNATLTWFGDRVGVDGLTFEFICSYVLYPVSFFMGTEAADCRKVAELIGVKTFTNEFIAYGQLKDLIANRKTFDNYTTFFNTTQWHWAKDDVILDITGEVLKGGFISLKSEIIATYALCGFANFGSIGITLGALGALAPTRKSDLSRMVVRAMICGNVACFLTACIAGLLFKEYA